MSNIEILKKLYNEYTKSFLPKILLSVLFSLLVAASTSAIAWLLDPAIKKIFIEKDTSLILLIPAAIVLAFTTKGVSLYFAKTILIRVGQEVTKRRFYSFLYYKTNSLQLYKKKQQCFYRDPFCKTFE